MDKNPSFEAAKRLRAARIRAHDKKWEKYLGALREAPAVDGNGNLIFEGMGRDGRPVDDIVYKPMDYERFTAYLNHDLMYLFGTTGE